MNKIKAGDHLLIRVEVQLDEKDEDAGIYTQHGFTHVFVKRKEIVAHEPHFEDGQRVRDLDRGDGVILKVRGYTAIVLFDNGQVGDSVLLADLSRISEPERSETT